MASHSLEKIKNPADEDADKQSFFIGAEQQIPIELAGRYEIIEEIGKGGMGVVYKARQPSLQKLYAIKMLHSVHVNETILRFEREARAISKLDHVNLITSHDFGVTVDGRPYMVMDFIEGTSLAHLIKEQGKLSLSLALDICVQIAKGMAYAHAQGVLHRDLKPGNIMLVLQPDGSRLVKIIDFGIAKILVADEVSNLTQTGDVFGSPYYMSPEQAVGRGIDERSDIYSLGCLFYEMLTGVLPFRGASAFETLYMHMHEPVPTLKKNSLKQQFPVPVERLVAKMLAKEQVARWQSMTELESELNSLQKVVNSPFQSLLQHVQFDRQSKFKFNAWYGTAIGAMLVMSVVGAISFWPSPQPEVHDKPEITASEDLREQRLDDPNELAKPVILNSGTAISLESLELNDQALKWFQKRNDVEKINLNGTGVTSSGIKYLSHLPLKSLTLNQTGVSDLALPTIAKIGTLERLELNTTMVTSAGLKSLIKLPNLKEIRLQDNNLEDSALESLTKFPKLVNLSLSKNPNLTDKAIGTLSKLTNLNVLRLSGIHVGDKGIKDFGRLRNLKTLDLTSTDVTDASMAMISRLPLRQLYLSNTSVTDEGVLLLKKCVHLDRLSVNSCPNVSAAAVRELRQNLAHCKVDHQVATDARKTH